MPSLTESKIFAFAPKQIYDLVMDIEQYPQFLPWCGNAKIVEIINEENLTADLLINFKNIFEKYRSCVKHGICANGYFIESKAISGPFQNLFSSWKITKIDDKHSQVDFFIEFKFNSFFLDKIIGPIFEKAALKMMQSFEKRLYESSEG